MPINSEFRLYPFIEKSLAELGWDIRNPLKGSGQVYTQNEALHDKVLKSLLGKSKPENIVRVTEDIFWVIEAKADHKAIGIAVSEAKEDYAAKINKSPSVKCLFATGVAGDNDSTHFVETFYLSKKGEWQRIQINGVDTTGFISRSQALHIIESDNPNIEDQEIKEELFVRKANTINEILHNGAINKKSRARVIASLLLALANDEFFRISDNPTTLIEDINARVRALLRQYDKENFAQEIAISLPTSKDNHKKNRQAIVGCIQELKSINIRSAINSSADLLGQFYEIFLKYANDSKEIGIVLTPRHITRFAAIVLNVENKDYIYDPTCGTGGFLVSALDRVKRSTPSAITTFKKSHIFGIEQDAEVVGLALVNMIFRGDGNSNIYEGNCLDNVFVRSGSEISKISVKKYNQKIKDGIKYDRFITKVLMNPPFAIAEEEYRFVDHALSHIVDGGLLFAILPTSTMSSTSDGRGEISWRKGLLKRHTLKAVIKLSDDLFMPNAHKGTYAIVIEAHKPHGTQNVFWAIMDDGFTMKKAKRLPSKNLPSNYNSISEKLQAFLIKNEEPVTVRKIINCCKIDFNDDTLDCGAEAYLKDTLDNGIDISSVTSNLFGALLHQRRSHGINLHVDKFKSIPFKDLIQKIDRGDCKPLNSIPSGDIPVITTTETNNGIDGYYAISDATLFTDSITIPANGSKYKAFYHPYKFAAVPDVLVCKLKPEYDSFEMKVFICAGINKSSWRFSYFRKCNETKIIKDVKIAFPIGTDGNIDHEFILDSVKGTIEYAGIQALINNCSEVF
jgi:type I restriction-modification system DNA methylase subunit